MDFDEREDKEAEMGTAVPRSYESITESAGLKMGPTGREGASTATPSSTRKPGAAAKYRECLKNHAVSIGGHALDGCGEFMAAGNEGTLDALKCAACNCHRNFHRKDTGGGKEIYHPHHPPQFSPYFHAPPPAGYFHLAPPPQQYRPLALPPASGGGGTSGGPGVGYMREDEDVSNPSSSGGGGASGSSKKRFRTKFTQEQKDKMLEFAERLGWRIQKHDEAAVEQFCAENGVRRRVLKVWMRNSKHTLGKKP